MYKKALLVVSSFTRREAASELVRRGEEALRSLSRDSRAGRSSRSRYLAFSVSHSLALCALQRLSQGIEEEYSQRHNRLTASKTSLKSSISSQSLVDCGRALASKKALHLHLHPSFCSRSLPISRKQGPHLYWALCSEFVSVRRNRNEKSSAHLSGDYIRMDSCKYASLSVAASRQKRCLSDLLPHPHLDAHRLTPNIPIRPGMAIVTIRGQLIRQRDLQSVQVAQCLGLESLDEARSGGRVDVASRSEMYLKGDESGAEKAQRRRDVLQVDVEEAENFEGGAAREEVGEEGDCSALGRFASEVEREGLELFCQRQQSLECVVRGLAVYSAEVEVEASHALAMETKSEMMGVEVKAWLNERRLM